MHVLFIGDNHGRTDWAKYVHETLKAGAQVVFMGDYLDSFDYDGFHIINNLKQIIALKRKQDEKRRKKEIPFPNVTLLLGNHDYAYMMNKTSSSGFNSGYAAMYYQILNENWDLFDLAWGHENDYTKQYTLVTHAGVLKSWWDDYVVGEQGHKDFIEKIIVDPWKPTNMHKVLNIMKDKFTSLWQVGTVRGGIRPNPSIIWADFRELQRDPFPGINQIVGHTSYHSPEIVFNRDGTSLIKVDGNGKDSSRLMIKL